MTRTIAEAYAVAAHTSHLEVCADVHQPADLIIAAGWSDETLGALLLRVRAEFDRVRAEMVADERHLSDLRRGLAELRGAAKVERLIADRAEGPTRAVWYSDAADRLATDIETAALTRHALVMTRLKSLREAMAAAQAHAITQATRDRVMLPDKAVAALAGRALAQWLDPLCPTCSGTGMIGGFGAPRSVCGACGGSARKTLRFAAVEQHHQFARGLQARWDQMSERAAGRMSSRLKG